MKHLIEPKQITEHASTDNTQPIVSIASLAFNHEDFVRDTLDGFLIQKTTFPVEILIHDDASTDNTASIIREYEKKYPDIIKPIYQTENQYSQGNKPGIINRSRARGKYIALCEGDDYWTDPLKLQKQVDFLEENDDFSMVCTNYSVVDGKKKVIQKVGWDSRNRDTVITQKIVLEKYTPQLLTVLIRKSSLDKIDPKFYKYRYPNGDVAFFAAVLEFGPCCYIDEITGCYRHAVQGIWAGKDINEQLRMKFITFKNLLAFFSGNRLAKKSIYKRMIKISRVLSILSFKKAAPLDTFKYFSHYIYYNIRAVF